MASGSNIVVPKLVFKECINENKAKIEPNSEIGLVVLFNTVFLSPHSCNNVAGYRCS